MVITRKVKVLIQKSNYQAEFTFTFEFVIEILCAILCDESVGHLLAIFKTDIWKTVTWPREWQIYYSNKQKLEYRW